MWIADRYRQNMFAVPPFGKSYTAVVLPLRADDNSDHSKTMACQSRLLRLLCIETMLHVLYQVHTIKTMCSRLLKKKNNLPPRCRYECRRVDSGGWRALPVDFFRKLRAISNRGGSTFSLSYPGPIVAHVHRRASCRLAVISGAHHSPTAASAGDFLSVKHERSFWGVAPPVVRFCAWRRVASSRPSGSVEGFVQQHGGALDYLLHTHD